METGLSGTVLRLAGLLSETAVRLVLVMAAATLLITTAVVHVEALPLVLAVCGGVALLWQPARLLTRRLEDTAPGEAARLRRQIDLLSTQVELLQREQRQLQAAVRWQGHFIEQLVEDAESPRARRAG